ncbi:MBL fold metallo-hydrolase [Candidatus Micrarchaeota archaeon]|nr:MBL fold metallo-hydrolase [Candidatus Micrarchaeota archaeon]
MKLTFLGTGCWHPRFRQTACTLLETDSANFIFDLGTGSSKLAKHLNTKKPTFVMLSHFHFDHFVGIFWLADVFKGSEITICGNTGVEHFVNKIMSKPFDPIPFKKLCKFKVGFRNLSKGTYHFGNAKIEVDFLHHSDTSLGYRVEADGKVFSYITDTQPCQASIELAKDADIMVHDSTWLEKDKSQIGKHSTAKEAATLARHANASAFYLYHCAPNYGKKELQQLLKEAKSVYKPTYLSEDDLVVKF